MESLTLVFCDDEPFTVVVCDVEPLILAVCNVEPLAFAICDVEPLTDAICDVEPLAIAICDVEPLTDAICDVKPLTVALFIAFRGRASKHLAFCHAYAIAFAIDDARKRLVYRRAVKCKRLCNSYRFGHQYTLGYANRVAHWVANCVAHRIRNSPPQSFDVAV
jgi:hypothetical protein